MPVNFLPFYGSSYHQSIMVHSISITKPCQKYHHPKRCFHYFYNVRPKSFYQIQVTTTCVQSVQLQNHHSRCFFEVCAFRASTLNWHSMNPTITCSLHSHHHHSHYLYFFRVFASSNCINLKLLLSEITLFWVFRPTSRHFKVSPWYNVLEPLYQAHLQETSLRHHIDLHCISLPFSCLLPDHY